MDYVITRQRDIQDVQITRAHRGTECWSDHRLLRSKVRVSISRTARKSKAKLPRNLNCERLKNPDEVVKFNEMMEKEMDKCTITDDVDASWKTLKDALYEKSTEFLGFPKRKNQDWFDESDTEASVLIQQLHQSHLKYINSKNDKKCKQHYLALKSKVQKHLRSMRDSWWETKANELQTAADTNNLKAFYSGLKEVYGPSSKQCSPLLSADGKELLTDENKILERWAEHYSEVLNRKSSADPEVIQSIPQRCKFSELDVPPNISETKDAIKQLLNGKLPGKDKIPGEVYKAGGPHMIKKLVSLYKKIWEKGSVPQDFKDATVISLFKNGKKSVCDNYRGISLLSIAGKILARVILNGVNGKLTDRIYSESQCGFRKGRGTTDMIFCLRQMQEKAREHKSALYMAFIDLSKAFDTVPRSSLWVVLEKMGIPVKMLNIIKSLHEGMQAQVIYGGKISSLFDVSNGTKQGCVLAPFLFALYFAAMLHYALGHGDFGVPISFRTSGGLFNIRRFTAKTKTAIAMVCELLFADDCALVAESMSALQEVVDSFSNACKAFGLTISLKKTEIVYQPPPQSSTSSSQQPPCVIKVNDTKLKVNNKFCYLGSTISEKATLDDEINHRIARASSSFGKLQDRLWKSHNISLLTKIKVYKAVIIPALLYGCETWTPYRRHINTLDAFHMRKLRSICNVSWRDKITNHEILSRCQITGIEAFMMRSQLRWAGHVVRMQDDRLPKAVLYGQLTTTRPMGRPLLRYKDKLKANINLLNLGEKDWEKTALQRSEWRAACYHGVTQFSEERKRRMIEDRQNRKASPSKSTVGTSFVCTVCRRRCKSKAGLKSHMKRHDLRPRPVEPLQSRSCDICSKVCKSRRGLLLHRKVHK